MTILVALPVLERTRQGSSISHAERIKCWLHRPLSLAAATKTGE